MIRILLAAAMAVAVFSLDAAPAQAASLPKIDQAYPQSSSLELAGERKASRSRPGDADVAVNLSAGRQLVHVDQHFVNAPYASCRAAFPTLNGRSPERASAS